MSYLVYDIPGVEPRPLDFQAYIFFYATSGKQRHAKLLVIGRTIKDHLKLLMTLKKVIRPSLSPFNKPCSVYSLRLNISSFPNGFITLC